MSASNGRASCRLVFFGDSICNGQGVSLHRGWVARLSASAETLSRQLGCDIIVVNASVNGSTTRQALERMAYEVQSHQLDILLVQFGLNDCNFWVTDRGLPRVSPEGFAANLVEIIRRGRRFGARRIFLNTNHPTAKELEDQPFWPMSYSESNRRYNEIIREVAARAGEFVQLNDIERAWNQSRAGRGASLTDCLLPDGLHLSLAGHDLYFEIIETVVVDAIREVCRQKQLEQPV